ncbi:hypothetical protein [Larsenimonas rhizosphaerae]|uniref:Uncharacterized protein n=1 Tax=Larsenimonas rhizosphaerae TaxID=2944682 RepID=A0AA41ZI09_9GAMM|nr:hypothetical protein [Larsenimonas rhizosphaerae]MCX2525594.1 hypothetical protein [Larsenimonas rhizosphaerae]
MSSNKMEDKMNKEREQELAEHLELELEQVGEMDLIDRIHEDKGNTGGTVYSCYFNVPEETPKEILEKKGWQIGDRVEVPC